MGKECAWRQTVIRLHITTEGQTEEGFVRQLLIPHLAQYGVYAAVRCVLTNRDKKSSREYRGGLLNYAVAKKDICNWLKEDRNAECRFTTMFDFYALPSNFPGYEAACHYSDPYVRVRKLEESLRKDIGDARFIPYIQLHEFEALILADPRKLNCEYLESDTGIANLEKLVQNIKPELIDDGAKTAPSKRIAKEIPEYDKAFAGPRVAAKIGLIKMKERCPHFAEWLAMLENLNSTTFTAP